MEHLKGRVGLVTGASRGLGRAIALEMARGGAAVAVAARSGPELESLAAEIRAIPGAGRPLVVAGDLSSPDYRAHLLETVTTELGPLGILVNNAGIERFAAFQDYSAEEIARYIDFDLTIPMQLTRLVLPAMLGQGQGDILNIASMAALKGVPFNTPYSAAKAALVAFSDGLRHELRGTGVAVTAILPGYVAGEGMYARHAGVAPVRGLLGTVTVERVARETVVAIGGNRGRVLIAPLSMRAGALLGLLAPGLITGVTERNGFREMNRHRAEADRGRRLE